MLDLHPTEQLFPLHAANFLLPSVRGSLTLAPLSFPAAAGLMAEWRWWGRHTPKPV